MVSGRENSVQTAAARADPLLFKRKLEKNATSPTAECRGRVWEGLGGHLWAWPGRACVCVFLRIVRTRSLICPAKWGHLGKGHELGPHKSKDVFEGLDSS